MMPKKESLTLREIAARIDAYLRRFERDLNINVNVTAGGAKRFYYAGAAASGGWVGICYVSYQGSSSLRRAEAEAYLKWLDAGNIGTHYAAKAQL